MINPIILSCTNDPSGTGRIYLQPYNASKSLVYSDVWKFERTRINRFNSAKMAVAGYNPVTQTVKVVYSTNFGLNWQSVAVLAKAPVRELDFSSDDHLVICTENELIRLNNFALDTYITTTSSIPFGDKFMDTKWINIGMGYLLVADNAALTPNAHIYYTENGGITWSHEDIGAATWSNSLWGPNESPRRISLTQEIPNNPYDIFILTSHQVHRYTHNATLTTTNLVSIWDYDGAVNTLFPSLPLSGKTSVGLSIIDYNTRFDDILIMGQRACLGGYSGLRAHSLNSFITWNLTDINLINPNGDNDNFFTHSYDSVVSGPADATIYAGNSLPASSLYPFRPCLNISSDNAITISNYYLYGPDENLFHHDTFRVNNFYFGCTHKESCEFQGIDIEDNQPAIHTNECSFAVKLISCSDQSVHMYTTSQAISQLACKRSNLELTISNYNIKNVLFTFTMSTECYGGESWTFSTFIPNGLPPNAVLSLIYLQIVAFINLNTPFSSLLNENLSAVIIYAPENYPEQLCGFSFISADDESVVEVNFEEEGLFNPGTPGRVVKLKDVEGCWYVCGYGPCDLAQEFQLEEIHEDCESCNKQNICMECDGMVTINGNPIEKCETTCYAEGDIITTNINVQTPNTASIQNDILDFKCECDKLTLNIIGNFGSNYPVGSQFAVVDINSNQFVYTVESIEYDPNTDITTIITVEICDPNMNEIIYAISNYDCDCSVQYYLIYNGSIIDNQVFQCDEFFSVEQTVTSVLENSGNYTIQIVASNCLESKICSFDFKICPEFEIRKNCYDLEITNRNYFEGNRIKVEILDIDNNIIFTDSFEQDVFLIEDAIEKDGVYVVRITLYNSDGEEISGPHDYTIIVLCALIKCVLKLLTEIWCNTDPCCEDDCTKDYQIKRDQLNRIFAIAMLLMAKQYKNKVEFLVDEENFEYENLSIQDLINKLTALTNRCGECSNGKTNGKPKTTSGCRNC